jgi:hypothetical protein
MSHIQRGFYILELQRVKKVENYRSHRDSRVYITHRFTQHCLECPSGVSHSPVIIYYIPLMPTAPAQKRKLSEGQVGY